MQVFEWLVLCATYAVVLFRVPFPLLARVALAAGYFVTFEYGVISRGYGLGVLLLVLTLTSLGRPSPQWWRAALTLGLLAWTSLAGGVLAVAIACVAVWCFRRRALLPMAGVAVASAIAALTCRPPADFVSFSMGIPSVPLTSVSATRIAGAFAGPWRGLVPVPLAVGRWNTNLLDRLPDAVWVQAALGVGLLALVAWALRPRVFAFRLWVLGTVGYLAFSVAVVLPDRSHYAGEFFLLFVACAWLAYSAPGRETPGSIAPVTNLPAALAIVLAIVLALQVVVLLAIVPTKTAHAFSPDEALARAARDAGAAHLIVSGQDFDAVAMAGFLDTRVYSVARGAWIRYFVNDRREANGNERMTDASILCAASRLADARDHASVVVVDRSLPATAGVRELTEQQGVRLYAVTPGAAACAAP
jgi:hypothetical protein